ncbi:MAG: hypothetical protein AcusKO_46130 [Acuticoccus sp.]
MAMPGTTPAASEQKMDGEAREVLARLLEYAVSEAEREGAADCAHHLHKALDALAQSAALPWAAPNFAKPILVS